METSEKHSSAIDNKLQTAKACLDALHKEGFYSYDLCDIQQLPYFTFIYSMEKWGKPGKGIVLAHKILLNRYSKTLRKTLRIPKQKFAQAQAFIVRAYILLKKHENTDRYDDIIRSEVDWIISQANTEFTNPGWGQPYDWSSGGKTIPAHTPRTTVTSQVIQCLLDVYEVFGDERFLKTAQHGGQFFLSNMPKSLEDDDKNETSLSYTTIDKLKVYNANMMACGAISRLYQHTKVDAFKNLATRLLNHTMNGQNTDGSWYYHDQKKPSKIDNFHTGYVIEGILYYRTVFGLDKQQIEKLNKGVSYYLKVLFTDSGLPKHQHNATYPFDIQCFAQSIITCVKLNKMDEAEHIYKQTIQMFYDTNTHLYGYRIYKNGNKDNNNYIRWGDAWMCYANMLLVTSGINSTIDN